jgi:hypothetical protein
MENIHLLATSKPSRLYYFGSSPELRLTKYPNLFRVFERSTQHLYITSDERFKVNEYITDNIEVIKATPKLTDAQGLVGRRNWRKIILTTDTDLIKDGIEVIPDEFIKWFIQNPSCKYVQTIEKSRCCGRCNGVDDLCYTDMCCVNHRVYGCETCYGKKVEYSITIPKEEPNMNKLQKEIFEMEQELGVPSNLRWHNTKPKQDIIASEEDAKIFVDVMINPPEPNEKLKDAFKNYRKAEHQLESEIEHLIIRWNNDSTRTAGSLAREIIELIK